MQRFFLVLCNLGLGTVFSCLCDMADDFSAAPRIPPKNNRRLYALDCYNIEYIILLVKCLGNYFTVSSLNNNHTIYSQTNNDNKKSHQNINKGIHYKHKKFFPNFRRFQCVKYKYISTEKFQKLCRLLYFGILPNIEAYFVTLCVLLHSYRRVR